MQSGTIHYQGHRVYSYTYARADGTASIACLSLLTVQPWDFVRVLLPRRPSQSTKYLKVVCILVTSLSASSGYFCRPDGLLSLAVAVALNPLQ
jgi:hypothetical protein